MSYRFIDPDNQHRLEVVGYHKSYRALECRVLGDNSPSRIFVDLLVDGTLPDGVTAGSLIGKIVEVDNTYPYISIAANPRIVKTV